MRSSLTLFAALAPALVAAAPANRPSADEQAALRRAEMRGALIYAYDQAAWHGTDDFAAKDPQRLAQAGGWIVDGPADAPVVTFVDRDPAAPRALYVGKLDGGRVAGRVLGDGDDRTLSPARLRLVVALRAVRASLGKGSGVFDCSPKPFNAVVLPPETPDGPVLVYLLSPQVRTGSYPIGGHWLVEVNAAGVAGPPRAFSKGCLTVSPAPGGPGVPAGAKPAGMFVTNLTDTTPTEVHVFSSLTSGLPLYVGTTLNGRLWAVEGRRIRPVGRMPGG